MSLEDLIRDKGYHGADAELTALRAQVSALQTEVKHWKDQHINEVKRAHILKDKSDLPLERVRAYELMGELQKMVSELNAANDELNAECCRLSLAEENATEKGAESMRERAASRIEDYPTSASVYCSATEAKVATALKSHLVTIVRAIPLKENEG